MRSPSLPNRTGGFPASYVVRHIRCVMWSTWLCGAEAAPPLIYWAFGIPNTT
jgi:hypothetical protein